MTCEYYRKKSWNVSENYPLYDILAQINVSC